MQEILLFEIPIYSMTKLNFDSKWKKFKQKMIDDYLNINNDLGDYKTQLNKIYLPFSIWRYNQIIGYIQISIENEDIVFDLYLTNDKNIHYNSKTKHFIKYLQTTGLHFYTGNKTDNEIKDEIDNYLLMIKNDFLKKNNYIDITAYNNIVKSINIKKIIKQHATDINH